jgi:predicted aconitase
MILNDEEKGMLAGDYGAGKQKAIELLIRLGNSFGAEKLSPVSYAHVSYDSCPEDFWDLLTTDVQQTPHTVTTHPSFQPELWRKWGLPVKDETVGEHRRKVKTIEQLGWIRTETCAEYLIGIIPQLGDIVSMAGSCMQVANNSLFGAKVERMGTLVSMAAAICGRTPLMGLLLPENRYASYLVELNDLNMSQWSLCHYQCLGYYIGSQVPGFKPVAVAGLPYDLPFDFARALIISMPTSGAITLAHLVGITPEAHTIESTFGHKKPEQVIRVGKNEMGTTWEKLNTWHNDIVENVTFGCPHANVEDIGRIAARLEGKKIKTSLIIGASSFIATAARNRGYTDTIEKAGGHIASVCPAIWNPFTRRDIAGEKQAKSVATNSARAAHYLATVSGVSVFFGTEEDCVNAALTGRWKGVMQKWK